LAEIYTGKLLLCLRRIHASAHSYHRAEEATLLDMFDQAFPRVWPKGLWNIQLFARDELNRGQRLVTSSDGGTTAPAPGERYS
jgi:hypothetical protein